MKPDPTLLDELYHRQKKNFPGELLFPERFNLKLTEDNFNNGKIRNRKRDLQKYTDWQGSPTKYESITVIEYEAPSRLDQAIRASFPKSFSPFSHIYSQLYENIEVGTFNEELDLEYNFFFHPADDRVKTMLMGHDTRETYAKSFYGDTLKVRIQYAERIVNSAGARFDCHGYIYIPKRN